MTKINEFEIIKKYFSYKSFRKDVRLGAGDDCALLKPPKNQLLAVSMDTLISGIHFPKDLSPYEIAYKSLAVNLSDLAAMGAKPYWFTCSLTLSAINQDWLKKFSKGLWDISKKYTIQLVGGDLTKGKTLSITIEVHGFVPERFSLKRSGAKIGDAIYLSGKLGEAYLHKYYYRPKPRVDLGLALRGKATSSIDISDGLLADLSHILTSSKVGASLYFDKIPLACEQGLYAGDDYELCFTAKPNLNIKNHKIYEIGKIEKKSGLRIYQASGALYIPNKLGYKHF